MEELDERKKRFGTRFQTRCRNVITINSKTKN
jgi:hypothetical protein